jgi:hypothetical protein
MTIFTANLHATSTVVVLKRTRGNRPSVNGIISFTVQNKDPSNASKHIGDSASSDRVLDSHLRICPECMGARHVWVDSYTSMPCPGCGGQGQIPHTRVH